MSSWGFVASLPSVLLFFTQGHVKLTNRIVGKRKVSSRKRKKVEYRPTEGDPRNTQASFRLQDFKMWKFSMFLESFAFHVLLLLALPPIVNSNEIPIPRMCAVCLDKDCATGVREIYPAGSDTPVWVKANSPTGIQSCSMENLKPDAPCKMANGSLAQPADNPLHFEGIDTYGVRRMFNSQILSCADLINSKPSPGMCAVCLDKDCAIGVREIYPAGSDAAIWSKANSRTGIQTCSMENLKADAPCKMADGSLVQLADETLRFEGINPPDKRRIFHSQSFPCADLINSKPSPEMCAVCLDKDCAIGVSKIYPADSDTAIWSKANSRTGIQTCSMENLKADAPCKMANGSLVQLADGTLRFEGINPLDKRRIFHSQSFPCADLINSKPSPVADNKGIIIGILIGSIGSSIGSIGIGIVILIGVLLWKRKKRGQGQDGDGEITIKKQPLKGEVPNENVNGVH